MAEHKPIDPTKPRIMCGEYDVTDHIAAMYDAIIGSMDWGSGFLSTDEIQSILIVGILAGWEYRNPPDDITGNCISNIPRPTYPLRPSGVPYNAAEDEKRWTEYKNQIDIWYKQVKAALEAKSRDCFDEQMCERVGTHLLSKVTTPCK